MDFHLYLIIWYVFHIPQFWRKIVCSILKSLIFKCTNHIRILPHFLGHRKPSSQFNKQLLLYHSSWNTLYNTLQYKLQVFINLHKYSVWTQIAKAVREMAALPQLDRVFKKEVLQAFQASSFILLSFKDIWLCSQKS